MGIIKSGNIVDIIAVDYDLDKNINTIMDVHFLMKEGKAIIIKQFYQSSVCMENREQAQITCIH